MTNQQGAPNALRSIARYKIGYATDDWGMRTSTPSGIPDPAGSWVRYADHDPALIETKHPTHESQADSELTEGGIKWQCGPLASGFTAPHPAAMAMAGSQPAPDEIINMAREQGLPETEIEGVFRVNADDLCRVAAAILAAGVPADSVTTPAGERENLALRRMLCVAHAGAEAFKAAHRHLGLDEVPDAWGQPTFKHSHVEASWLGWIARAARKQGGV